MDKDKWRLYTSGRPIRIHCIDYDRWPSEYLPVFHKANQSIYKHIQKDLENLCKKTGTSHFVHMN